MSSAHKVGVTTSVHGSTSMWVFYWLALQLAGLSPVRLTSANAHVHDLDTFNGFVIGGGDNIGAGIYQGDLTLDVKIDPDRDLLELAILKAAEERRLPVLGVCRGAQIVNVHRGGSLHQDIHSAYENSIIRKTRFRANSLHRQSVDRLGKGLRVSAHDRYGIIQAVECEDLDGRFLLGVQWHPEFMIYRAAQRRIFKALRDAVCAGNPDC
jgi:putative glutamine amidotransferase